jgi:hypothetical protein
MFAAIRRASSLLSSFAAERRPGSLVIDVAQRVPVCVAHDGTVRRYLSGSQGRGEAAVSHYCLFLAAAGRAGRTSAHGSDFFFCSGISLRVDW